MREYAFSVLVENEFGVLSRIVNLFSSRGYNIRSLAVGETENPSISRMIISVLGEAKVIEQIKKQLNRLINTIKVVDLSEYDAVERELALIKINSNTKTRADIFQIAEVFRAKVVDISITTLTVEVTGVTAKIEAIIELLRQFGIKEIVRTGKIAITRGA